MPTKQRQRAKKAIDNTVTALASKEREEEEKRDCGRYLNCCYRDQYGKRKKAKVSSPSTELTPEMQQASQRVQAACAANGVAFLAGANPENVAQKIDAGARVISGGREETARAGRAHSGRQMPV